MRGWMRFRRGLISGWGLATCLLLTGYDSEAQESRPSADGPSNPATRPADALDERPCGRDILETDRLTGDWLGARTRLEDLGVTIDLAAHNQFMVNMHGGRETTNGNDFGGSYNLELTFDLQKLGIVPDGLFIFESKGTWGGEISDFDSEKVGGLSKTNADAKTEEPIFVDKWWWCQKLLDGRVEFRLGRIESEKDLFDVNTVAGHEDKQFMNKALVINPAISHKLGLGAFVKVQPVDWFYVQGAVIDPEGRDRRTGFDTAFHGADRASVFYELGLLPRLESENGQLPGRYLLGSWFDPGPKELFASGAGRSEVRSDDVGVYVGFEQRVYKENDDPEDVQGASVFGRYGCAHGDVNLIQHFWSTGGEYEGLIPGRDGDVIGFGVAQSMLSDCYRRYVNARADRETVYELYYALHITPWCTLSPDFQYVTNTGGDKDDPHTMVGGLRLRVVF